MLCHALVLHSAGSLGHRTRADRSAEIEVKARRELTVLIRLSQVDVSRSQEDASQSAPCSSSAHRPVCCDESAARRVLRQILSKRWIGPWLREPATSPQPQAICHAISHHPTAADASRSGPPEPPERCRFGLTGLACLRPMIYGEVEVTGDGVPCDMSRPR